MARRNISRKNRKANRSRKNRRNNRTNRTNRRNGSSRRNTRRTMYGGESAPGSTAGNSMANVQAQSLAQGRQFEAYHANQHGGFIEGGPFPDAVTKTYMLPESLHASARIAPQDAALRQIANLRDQDGGRRRRKGRKGSRKHTRRGRKRVSRGGGLENAAPFGGPTMLLPAGLEAKALTGMNSEWKLAEDPKAFAPGYKTY